MADAEQTPDGITVSGVHNPEHCFGDVEIEVDVFTSKPRENMVSLSFAFPNGTYSSVDLSPEQARAVGEWLIDTAHDY